VVKVSAVEAARMCATTPADRLRLRDTGRIALGAVADLTVLDAALNVQSTILRGEIFRNTLPSKLV
jgi:N-acetylglucosamine-6-phosphate deacetylase